MRQERSTCSIGWPSARSDEKESAATSSESRTPADRLAQAPGCPPISATTPVSRPCVQAPSLPSRLQEGGRRLQVGLEGVELESSLAGAQVQIEHHANQGVVGHGHGWSRRGLAGVLSKPLSRAFVPDCPPPLVTFTIRQE